MRGELPEVTPFLRLGGREWRWPTAIRALAHRNYRLFWLGQLVSLTGTWMQRTAQQWLVYRLTGSAFQLGLVTFASFLPVLFLAPFAGVVVDRMNKRTLVTAAQAAAMLHAGVLAALTLTGVVQLWHIVVLAFTIGVVDAFEMPARQAFVIELTGREDLMNAIALNSSVFNGTRILGPALAGLIVAGVGEGAAFAINSLSYLAVIGGLLAMQLRPAIRSEPNGHLLDQIRGGLGYVAGHATIRTLVGMVGVFSFFGLPYVSLIPVFAVDFLSGGPRELGLMISSVGVGALTGALSLAAFGHVRRKGWLVTAGTLVFALSLAVFSLSRWLPLSALALAVAGWAQITQLATTNTLLQTQVSDEMRGRVMSTYTWTLSGLFPVGALAMGALAQQWSASTVVLAGAAVCGLFAVLVAWRLPQVRELE